MKILLIFDPNGPITNIRPGAVRTPSHYMDQWWLVIRRIYATLGLIWVKRVNLHWEDSI